jgi:hypothetical protein
MRDYDGKTADERVAERRARLIAGGVKLFDEHGYAGTPIRSVLRQSGLRDRMLLGRGVVAAPDELLLAWLDNESDVSRKDVVELVMVFFDAVAHRVGD